jgi:cell division protein ZapD
MSDEVPGQILYEYPLNERIRSLLRLEDLFDKLAYFCAQEDPYCHHTALLTLFEIVEVTSRSDIKSDLFQELERYRGFFSGLKDNPQVAQDALLGVLGDIETSQAGLNATPGKIGQHLRDNDWLMSVRGRSIIPGGTCEFDIPSYHAWLSRPLSHRSDDLQFWVRPLEPFRSALALALRLLRESASHSHQLAGAGLYQQNFQGRTFALLQVRVSPQQQAIPEISANKYMLWIRFTQNDRDLKPRALERDIDFDLALCAI